jgi:ABC-2 type transport system permease protein
VSRTLRAEWTKLRTVPSTGWLLLATVLATTIVAAAIADGSHPPPCQPGLPCAADTPRLALYGARVGQVAAVVLAVLAVTGEYTAGLIRQTLAATPGRYRALAAKTAVSVAAAMAAGALAVVCSLAVAAQIFAARGYTEASGYPPLRLTDPAALRAAVGTVVYFGLVALLSSGVATVLRDSAAALIAVFALLFAFPILAATVNNVTWQRRLHQWSPMDAGLGIQATTDLAHLPLTPGAGLAVLAAWAAGAAMLGGLLFRYRDA